MLGWGWCLGCRCLPRQQLRANFSGEFSEFPQRLAFEQNFAQPHQIAPKLGVGGGRRQQSSAKPPQPLHPLLNGGAMRDPLKKPADL